MQARKRTPDMPLLEKGVKLHWLGFGRVWSAHLGIKRRESV